jgi:hypothetical protein
MCKVPKKGTGPSHDIIAVALETDSEREKEEKSGRQIRNVEMGIMTRQSKLATVHHKLINAAGSLIDNQRRPQCVQCRCVQLFVMFLGDEFVTAIKVDRDGCDMA